jgi:hypothetical protein
MQSAVFLSVTLTKTLYTIVLHIRATCPAHLFLLDLITK